MRRRGLCRTACAERNAIFNMLTNGEQEIQKVRRFASASGSFWFPGITEFVQVHQMAVKPDKIYFSIGDKESDTRNKLLSKVEERTKWLAEWYAQQEINTVFVRNSGNHFNQAVLRMAKGDLPDIGR